MSEGLAEALGRRQTTGMFEPQLQRDGFVFVPGATLRGQLGALDDWDAFVASWDSLELDRYMADGGRYRRRRHAVLRAARDGIQRLPHQPHFQSRDYNALNGGIERWFEPIRDEVVGGASMQALLDFCLRLFGALSPSVRAWRVEVHQFRIEAGPLMQGQPTPEGVHRDGVDWALVCLVRRTNIQRGVTTVHAHDGSQLGSFTLTEPLDAALVDDRRVLHGVTAVQPLEPLKPAHRDVLVVTLRSEAAPA